MNPIQIKEYLSETLHQPVSLRAWDGTKQLPLYLPGNYEFQTLSVLRTEVLLLTPREDVSLTPAMLEKQLHTVKKSWPGPVCVCFPAITPHTRKRLIEKQIQFIVPGTQLYLPCLGLDLREYFAAPHPPRAQFGPSAQALLLYILERGLPQVTTKDVTQALGCSLMTATRALDELLAAGLCEKTGPRKNAVFLFGADKARLWETAKPHLKSPVQRRLWISALPGGFPVFMAGLEALSEYTEIAASHQTVAASGAAARELLAQPGVEQLPYQEPGAVELEVWRYDPAVCARGGVVDPRSLWLTFAGETDDRTLIELERMESQW